LAESQLTEDLGSMFTEFYMAQQDGFIM